MARKKKAKQSSSGKNSSFGSGDGLIANAETSHEYEEAPLRRVRRHFEFPELTTPGVYVVDFIGNGQSSRALIRKACGAGSRLALRMSCHWFG